MAASGSNLNLDGLARRVEPLTDWSALALPDQVLRELRRCTDDVKQWPRIREAWQLAGILERIAARLLLLGGSAIDRTVAVAALAGELEVPVYRVDLGANISKYVGETEKYLSAVFDAAERRGVWLFLDEADTLFNMQPKDSGDRPLLLGVAGFLLGRMELLSGLTVVGIGRSVNPDPFFTRRMHYVVQLPQSIE